MCVFLFGISESNTEKKPEKEKQEEKSSVDCLLSGLFRGCFLPGQQNAAPVNRLLTWAYNPAEGAGLGGAGAG